MVESDDSIVISFCIPTYNRAECVKRSVMSILEIDSRHIEIVIVDNNSQDNTEQIIKSINDDRVCYYKNQTNIGAVCNIVRTINLAKGKWVFTLSDEDIVVKDTIDWIIKDLSMGKHSDTAVLFGNITKTNGSYYKKYDDAFFLKGDDAIFNVGFSHAYLSGIIINKSFINCREIDGMTPESDGVYPHIIILTRACINGDAKTMNKDFIIMMEPRAKTSYVEKPSDEVFAHPVNRLKEFKIFANLANDIISDNQLKIQKIESLYFQYLNASTYGWERVISSESSRSYLGLNNDISFSFWRELDKYNFEVNQYFDEVITEPEIRKALDEIIYKKLLIFKLGRLLGPVRNPLFWVMKRIHNLINK